jgi:hypothetical protein
MSIESRITELKQEIEALERCKDVYNLLKTTIVLAEKDVVKRTKNDPLTQESPGLLSCGRFTQFMSQHLYGVTVPRACGKTTAYKTLKLEATKNVVFVENRQFSHSHRGYIRPFGFYAQVLVFDEEPNNQALECILSNWLIWGYNNYPNVVYITTPIVGHTLNPKGEA